MKYVNKSRGSARSYTTNTRLSTHFQVWEFNKRGEFIPAMVHPDLIAGLEELRSKFGRPIIINSGYRPASYNDALDGAAQNSYHVDGLAADIRIDGVPPELVARTALSIFGGVGLYPTFTHVDVGPVRYWLGGGLRETDTKASLFVQMAQDRRVNFPSGLADSVSSWFASAGGFLSDWWQNTGEISTEYVWNPVGSVVTGARDIVDGVGELAQGVGSGAKLARGVARVGVPLVLVSAVGIVLYRFAKLGRVGSGSRSYSKGRNSGKVYKGGRYGKSR